MSKNKKPHPSVPPDGWGKEQDFNQENFTMNGTEAQGRIFPLLLEGEENALPGAELAQLSGYKNERSMRVAVDRERELGLPVLASEAGYYRPAAGDRGIAEVRRFLRRQDGRAASNRRTTRLIRARLREMERGPLPGQVDFWGGDDT